VLPATLKDRLNADIKNALKAGQKDRVIALRLITAAIKQQEVDQRITVDDAGILAILDKLAKQRRESIQHFANAHRADLVTKESAELDLILSYLPEPLDDAAVGQAINHALESLGAQTMKDMGRVMAHLKTELQGRVDMAAVSARVKQRLGG
jgi:uncharacterized protein YqeY